MIIYDRNKSDANLFLVHVIFLFLEKKKNERFYLKSKKANLFVPPPFVDKLQYFSLSQSIYLINKTLITRVYYRESL